MNDNAQKFGLVGVSLGVPILLVAAWANSAQARLKESSNAAKDVAVASMSDDSYCTPRLKTIIRRVAGACGLLEGGGGRGCQPTDAKNVAAMSGDEFNALFSPLSKRAHIIQFDANQVELAPEAAALVEKAWSDQRGASFFFVVARASTDGSSETNEALSRDRAKAVLTHLQGKFKDEDLKNQVGLLWLGEQYAQLGDEFCAWSRSGTGECTPKEINRSAFVAWIDCAI
jgi:outer membrane protein OmpA-like peptidoglycan-associated protein